MEQGTVKPSLYPFTAPKTKGASLPAHVTPSLNRLATHKAETAPNQHGWLRNSF